MKIKPDFKAMTAYDWKYFTKEDYSMYKDILLAEPYNPELAEFFYEQNLIQHKLDSEQRNHTYIGALDEEQMSVNESTEDWYLREEEKDKLYFGLRMLSPIESERLMKACVENKTYKQIALETGVSPQAIGKNVTSAIHKMRKLLDILINE